MSEFDAVVVGMGAAGLSALVGLSELGLRVIGFDQYPQGHDKGSSHADSRLFRQAYFEGEAYVPILKYCYETWRQWNRLSATELFQELGLHLFADASDSTILAGSEQSALQHQIRVEKIRQSQLSSDDWRQRFALSNFDRCLSEPTGGLLLAEASLNFLAQRAYSLGAQLCYEETVEHQTFSGGQWSVTTSRGRQVRASRRVLCPGAWLPSILPKVPAQVALNAHLWWRLKDFQPRGCWGMDTELGFFYGMPSLDGETVKINVHGEGPRLARAEDASPDACQPLIERVRSFINRYLPQQEPQLVAIKPCLYTHSLGDQFYIEHFPPATLLIGGLSGHGFKFLPAFALAAAQFAKPDVALQTPQVFNLPLFRRP